MIVGVKHIMLVPIIPVERRRNRPQDLLVLTMMKSIKLYMRRISKKGMMIKKRFSVLYDLEGKIHLWYVSECSDTMVPFLK